MHDSAYIYYVVFLTSSWRELRMCWHTWSCVSDYLSQGGWDVDLTRQMRIANMATTRPPTENTSRNSYNKATTRRMRDTSCRHLNLAPKFSASVFCLKFYSYHSYSREKTLSPRSPAYNAAHTASSSEVSPQTIHTQRPSQVSRFPSTHKTHCGMRFHAPWRRPWPRAQVCTLAMTSKPSGLHRDVRGTFWSTPVARVVSAGGCSWIRAWCRWNRWRWWPYSPPPELSPLPDHTLLCNRCSTLL